MKACKKIILFFVTEDWFFCSHFLERAIAAREAGYDVVVLTQVLNHGEKIKAAGLRLIPLQIDRRSLNPLAAARTLIRVIDVYKAEQPTIVHHVALKPIVLGTLAARLMGIRRVVNAVIGMGYAFTTDHLVMRTLRPLLTYLLKQMLNPPGSQVVFENRDDLRFFVDSGKVRPDSAVLIRGAGVSPADYSTSGPKSSLPVIVLVARMLWDKGIGEFVEAARILKESGIAARFVLVGDVDPGNRASLDRAIIDQWIKEGVVEWWGFRSDMPVVLQQADIACLPSYREGLPKSLLEAMAASLPCVTTDVPGCREAVKDGDNGILVPPRDAASLAMALRQLIDDPELRLRMGKCGRRRLEDEFSTAQVVLKTLALYREMID